MPTDRPSILVRPRLVALDTSLLSAVSRDKFSRLPERRGQASTFVKSLGELGCVVLLCWHHLEELIAHRDPQVVSDRLAFIRSLPMLAWIPSASGDESVGSIVDILAVETSAALEPDSSAESVRDRAAGRLVKFGTGEQALLPFESHWELLREHVWEREEKTREIVAISRSNYIDSSKAKLKDLQNARLRSPADVERQFELMQKRLAQDIQLRGDKRIKDPAAAAARFLDDVKSRAVDIFTDASDPTLQMLRSQDIDPSRARPNTTTTDIGDLAAFHHRLRIVSEILAVPFVELKTRVAEWQIPSCVIQGAINRYSQDAQERKGSDLTDNYLACLAAYADITYVDKRTLENVRRAQQKCPELATLLRRVEKAGHYQLILNQLASWRPEGQSNP